MRVWTCVTKLVRRAGFGHLSESRVTRPLLESPGALHRAAITFSAAHANHIEGCGIESHRAVCEQDLESIVANWKDGAYGKGWFKIRNRHYSQYEGRR